MSNDFSQMDEISYVAKYVDETGCSLEQACKDLGVDSVIIFSEEKEEY